MPNPKNASTGGDGFRFYSWVPSEDPTHQALLQKYGATERTDVLSVTSIRKLAGESFVLVAWQIANVIDVAMGTIKRDVTGPRGGVKTIHVKDEYPGEFIRRMLDAGTYYDDGSDPTIEQASLDNIRRWLRESAEEPRNIAAARGTIVHEAIELNVKSDRIEREYVEAAFKRLSAKDQKRLKSGVTDEDILFVRRALRQYEAMRREKRYVILAREPQVWNLTAGYGGSTDVLLWVLPEGSSDELVKYWQKRADKGNVTVADVAEVGGHLVLGDYKTSKGVYTDQIVQATAYTAAEFIGTDGVIDQRLTDLLNATMQGVLIHIRPDFWEFDEFDFEDSVLRAFLGSVAFARFLATYPKPEELFTRKSRGEADPEEETE